MDFSPRKLLPAYLTRIRPSLGNTGLFLLLYGAYSSTLYQPIFLPIMLSYILIHVAADCLNDKFDYEIDQMNSRLDKLTISGIITPNMMGYIASVLYLIAITIITAVSLIQGVYTILLAELYFLAVFSIYSIPSLNIRKKPLASYALLSSAYAIIPFMFAPFFALPTGSLDLIFSFLVFLQFSYILIQKDFTDIRDPRSIFEVHGRRSGELLMIIVSAAVLAYLTLFALATTLLIIPLALMNFFVKLANWYILIQRILYRGVRVLFVNLDYLSFFMCGVVLLL